MYFTVQYMLSIIVDQPITNQEYHLNTQHVTSLGIHFYGCHNSEPSLLLAYDLSVNSANKSTIEIHIIFFLLSNAEFFKSLCRPQVNWHSQDIFQGLGFRSFIFFLLEPPKKKGEFATILHFDLLVVYVRSSTFSQSVGKQLDYSFPLVLNHQTHSLYDSSTVIINNPALRRPTLFQNFYRPRPADMSIKVFTVDIFLVNQLCSASAEFSSCIPHEAFSSHEEHGLEKMVI